MYNWKEARCMQIIFSSDYQHRYIRIAFQSHIRSLRRYKWINLWPHTSKMKESYPSNILQFWNMMILGSMNIAQTEPIFPFLLSPKSKWHRWNYEQLFRRFPTPYMLRQIRADATVSNYYSQKWCTNKGFNIFKGFYLLLF